MKHVLVISDIAISNKGFFSHVNFSYCDRKGQNSCYKLPKYGNEVTQDVEQSDLDGANLLCCLHYVTKCPEREEHGIEAVKIASYDEGSVVGHGF